MRASVALLTVAAMSYCGCAAVFKGSTQTVRFTSVPEAVDVRIDSRYAGSTPTEAEIHRGGGSSNVLASKPGYREQYVQVARRADTPWFIWDIATCVVPVTLCVPLLVDAISGAWYSIDDEYRVKLDPLAPPIAAPVATSTGTTIVTPGPAPAVPLGF